MDGIRRHAEGVADAERLRQCRRQSVFQADGRLSRRDDTVLRSADRVVVDLVARWPPAGHQSGSAGARPFRERRRHLLCGRHVARKADQGPLHLEAGNPHHQPLGAGVLRRRRQDVGDKLDFRFHTRRGKSQPMNPNRRDLTRLSLLATAMGALPINSSLAITAKDVSVQDHAHDFDFFFGDWKVRHRQLKTRLAGSSEWIAFDGTARAQPLLNGIGNVDDNFLDKPGDPYRAATVRAFDAKTGQWAIWWLDGRTPHGPLDPPMLGSFENGVGTFLADNEINGKTVKVRFIWSKITDQSCQWEQAFSPDGGKTWETNWVMNFTRTHSPVIELRQ